VTPVLIDTDPGIDDAVAIMFALKMGLEVKAITAVSGNLPADRTAANARKVLELMALLRFRSRRVPRHPRPAVSEGPLLARGRRPREYGAA